MDKLVETLAHTPLPTILVVGGIVFLFLAIGGQLGARFSTERLRPRHALVLGLILLAIGIWLQVVQAKSGAAEPVPPKEKAGGPSPSASIGLARAESYSLRIPAVKGKVIRTTSRFDVPEMAISLEEGGKYSKGGGSISNESTSRTEIIAVENSRPIVMHQYIIRDSRSTTMNFENAEPVTEAKKGPLEGATILVESKNGRWVQTLMGEVPNKAQKAELQHQFIDADDIYPTEKVSPGYSWQLKDYQLAYFFRDAFSISGTAWCKFSGVEIHQDQRCAVISVRIEISARMLIDNEPAEVSLGANDIIYRALDTFVDVEESADGQMTMKSSWISEGSRTTMEMAGPFHLANYNSDITARPDLGMARLPRIRMAMFAPFGESFLNISPVSASAQSSQCRRRFLPP